MINTSRLCNEQSIVLAGRGFTEMPDTERRKPEASSSSDFLPSLRPQKLLEGAAARNRSPYCITAFAPTRVAVEAASRKTQFSHPTTADTAARRTDRRKSAEPFKLHREGCIDDILRPTSEHDQLRTSPASELRQNRNTCNSSPHCEAKRQGTAFRLSVARKVLRIEY